MEIFEDLKDKDLDTVRFQLELIHNFQGLFN